MIEIMIHGRGGQGAVTAAKILATAALEDGKFATYRPGFFAAERQGAPVKAFVRIADEEFYLRHKIIKADIILVLDPSLVKLQLIDFANSLKEGGSVIINANLFSVSGLNGAIFIDAAGLALKHNLGKVVNTAILGILAQPPFKVISIDALEKAVRKNVPRKIEENIAALKEAFEIAGGRR